MLAGRLKSILRFSREAESVMTEQHVALGLGIGRFRSCPLLANLERLMVMQLCFVSLAESEQDIAHICVRNRQIASGLGIAGISRRPPFVNRQRLLVVRLCLARVAQPLLC